MKSFKNIYIKHSAFSLIELAIILTMVGVICSSFFALASFISSREKAQEFESNIQSIYSAIGNFVATNRRLPCPAPLNLSKSEDSGYGVESSSTSGGCSAVANGVFRSTSSSDLFYGALPFASLRLDHKFGEDPYGSKLIYIVDQRLAKAANGIPDFNNPSFSAIPNTITSIIKIRKRDYSGSLVNIDMMAIFAIIGQGPNKNGAFPADSRLGFTAPIETNELDNYFANPTTFDDQIIAAAESSDDFDDYVYYKNRNQLVSDFNLQILLACDGSLVGADYPTTSVFFNQNVYANAFCSNPAGAKKYRRCGNNGVWDAEVACSNLQ